MDIEMITHMCDFLQDVCTYSTDCLAANANPRHIIIYQSFPCVEPKNSS